MPLRLPTLKRVVEESEAGDRYISGEPRYPVSYVPPLFIAPEPPPPPVAPPPIEPRRTADVPATFGGGQPVFTAPVPPAPSLIAPVVLNLPPVNPEPSFPIHYEPTPTYQPTILTLAPEADAHIPTPVDNAASTGIAPSGGESDGACSRCHPLPWPGSGPAGPGVTVGAPTATGTLGTPSGGSGGAAGSPGVALVPVDASSGVPVALGGGGSAATGGGGGKPYTVAPGVVAPGAPVPGSFNAWIKDNTHWLALLGVLLAVANRGK